jgi:hypothetical protein
MQFNMNRTWSQAMALLRANFQLLAIIAGVFLLLPALLLALLVPDALDFSRLNQDPEAVQAQMEGMLGPILIYGLVSAVMQFIGYGAMVALIGDERPTVAEAILTGVRCLPTIIAATLLFMLGYVALALLAGVAIAAIGAGLGAVGAGGVGAVLAFLLVVVLLAAMLYVMTRLSLTLPIVVLEGVRNPVTGLRRSWQLTRPHGGAIFGFYALLMIAYFVISLLLVGFLGVIGAALGPGTASALFGGLVNGLIGALAAMVMSGILVSMHQQLAGRSVVELSETFR